VREKEKRARIGRAEEVRGGSKKAEKVANQTRKTYFFEAARADRA